MMHASIRRFQTKSDLNDDLAHHGRRLAATLSTLPGFVSFAIVEAESGCLASIVIFEDRAGLEAAERATSEWLREHFSELDTDLSQMPIISGEIVVQRGM